MPAMPHEINVIYTLPRQWLYPNSKNFKMSTNIFYWGGKYKNLPIPLTHTIVIYSGRL